MKTIIFVLLTMMVSTGCLKDLFDAKLPDATTTGAHIFGCKVNGKSWIPDGSHSLFVSVGALSAGISQWQGRKFLHISARKDPSIINKEEGDSYDDMNFDVILPANPGELIINETCTSCGLACPYSSLRCFVKGLTNGGCYMTTSTHTGKIQFSRIDTLNGIVSGTFEFSAIDTDTGKTINVTDGRFDVLIR
jgi:hypothetical protein